MNSVKSIGLAAMLVERREKVTDQVAFGGEGDEDDAENMTPPPSPTTNTKYVGRDVT